LPVGQIIYEGLRARAAPKLDILAHFV